MKIDFGPVWFIKTEMGTFMANYFFYREPNMEISDLIGSVLKQCNTLSHLYLGKIKRYFENP